jgi:hypothetical protein
MLTCLHTPATFRLVVFRPFAGEVLVGKIMGSDEIGIRGECAVRENGWPSAIGGLARASFGC